LKFSKSVLVVSTALLLYSCVADKALPVEKDAVVCDMQTVSFSGYVQPVLLKNCSVIGCHDAGTGTGGYVFETYDQISANMISALASIKHEPGIVPMPYLQPQLADTTIRALECWLNDGMPDD